MCHVPYKCCHRVGDPTGQVYKRCQENNRRIHIHKFISSLADDWGLCLLFHIEEMSDFPKVLVPLPLYTGALSQALVKREREREKSYDRYTLCCYTGSYSNELCLYKEAGSDGISVT